ncbi:homoserine kinase [Pontixanthobacter aestiaquae]|uniref:Homoserine kinase n=1 Tax=Pontixanthobacter aestiaquae TaxID=1509367 RepID=A0A844Z7Y8_9SPHN|nr:homoserine kinase [Pontixanthobacter aestiaquae]MDN3646068.1 homoserine kinase [Pontixanthobacter aestiaquae]MXO82940.1 homoserine kinase [Pontixanthobacter aestiaquae]
MAVYTHLSAETLEELIAEYDVGKLVSAKGIAEGISNSNWLIETTGKDGEGARFILTMYEYRIDIEQLPFFLNLLDHLAARGCPVPATIHDRQGNAYRDLDGKAVALIEFLQGVSIGHPTAEQAFEVGAALAQIQLAADDFTMTRTNDLRPPDWRDLFDKCGMEAIAGISEKLADSIGAHLPALLQRWPEDLPIGTIHADLFPDNVLVLGNTVSGLIDFYFACTDFLAYDLAVAHTAWCFSADGSEFRPDISAALLKGYASKRTLNDEERAALPLLAKGAAMRFIATRSYDWINTPAEALVMRKNPMDYVRRLRHYDALGAQAFAPLT